MVYLINIDEGGVCMAEYKTYSIILGMKYDAEILGKLESVKNKSSYIKGLIQQDIDGKLNGVTEFTNNTEDIARQYSNITEEKYKEQFDNNMEKTITFNCNINKNDNLIKKIDSAENKSEYIKRLILMDMGLINQGNKRFVFLDDVESIELLRVKNRKSDKKRAERQKEYGKRTGYTANKKWAKENLKRIPLDVNLDMLETIDNYISMTGESRNGFIKRAINEAIERDNKV